MNAHDYPEFQPFVDKLAEAGMPPELTADFGKRYAAYRAGDSGKLSWDDVRPAQAEDIAEAAALPELDAAQTQKAVGELVCIKLNGGLGTTMKLARAKSLIAVREGRSFLRLIADQLSALRQRHGVEVPLLLMNSYRTRDDSLAELEAAAFGQGGMPLDFLQHKVPRIDAATKRPAQLPPGNEADEWTPPGHGDIYLALALRGLLDTLLARGVRWAFVSNVDNLGATIDPRIPAYLDQAGLDFAMEVTPKTPADIKGGPLARWRDRLMLIERSQVPEHALPQFEDITRFREFNTNSLWWNVEAVRDAVRADRLNMPMIVNPKTVLGQDVVQLETAMGAAIGSFERAGGLRVSRRRFAPVKATWDLLGVRSDAYVLDEAGGLRPNPARDAALGPPLIELDKRFYQGIADFEARLPQTPSLLGCRSLKVVGDVSFGRDVVLTGDVEIRVSGDEPRCIADGTRLDNTTLEL
jgi:UTP--glucose-1-phosphate uridylyltransferase